MPSSHPASVASRSQFLSRAALGAATTLVLLAGCGGSSTTTTAPTPTSTPAPVASNPLANVVFIGDSLTAGFQNGSLLDTQQPNGYPSLLATQFNFSITLPLIAAPGAPAVLELVSVGPPPVVQQVSGTTTGRDNPSQQPTNLAVPGHLLHDLINTAPTPVPTSDEAIITNLVLGFPVGNTDTQLGEAIALKPTTLVVWAGSDDALQADEAGMPSAMTSLASFTSDYTQLMTTLQSKTTATLFVANVPDVTAIPYMTPAATIISEVAADTGLSPTVISAVLGIVNGDLINANGLKDLEADEATIKSGQVPGPLPDGDVLTVAEIAQVQSNINSYNQVITKQAAAVGATVIDMHGYFATLTAGVTINGYMATNTFLGGLFALDGIHPTNTGYALLANQFLAALNTKLSLTAAAVNVGAVAAKDPYFGPNIKPVGSSMRIPLTAAQAADRVLRSPGKP